MSAPSVVDPVAALPEDAAPLPVWLMQSDVQLMEGEGAAAAGTLRTALQRWPAHSPRPRLIAISGEHGPVQPPFDARLPKPCRPKELIATMESLLRAHAR